MKKIIALILALSTSAYASGPTAQGCPTLITHCISAEGQSLGDITYPSTFHGLFPECKAIMTQDAAIQSCLQAYPDTRIVLYVDGATSYLLKASYTNSYNDPVGIIWLSSTYTHKIDLPS